MNLLRSLRCQLRGFWETVTMPDFWQSLLQPPLVTVSGHVWPTESLWTQPVMDPEHGPIEYDASACVQCGHIDSPLPWRLYHGPLSSTPATRPERYPVHPISVEEVMAIHGFYQKKLEQVVAAFRASRAGTAVTDPPAPPATPEASTPQPAAHFVGVLGGDESSWSDLGPIRPRSRSSTGAPAQTDSSTSTPTPSRALPRSHEVC